MEVCRWVHPVLLLALILPGGYTMLTGRVEKYVLWMYLAGWLLLPFSAVIHLAVRYTRYYFQYLLVCVFALAAGGACAYLAAGCFPSPACRVAVIVAVMAELSVIMLDAEEIRRNEIQRKRALKENDIFWKKHASLLEHPRQGGLVWFAFFYLLGLGTNCPIFCNISLGSGIVYMVLWLLYQNAQHVESYLAETAYIAHVPGRRIRSISFGILIFVLAAVAACGLASIAAIRYRRYTDIREIKGPSLPEETQMYYPAMPPGQDISFFEEIAGLSDEPYRPSPLAPVVQAAATFGAALFLLYGMWRMLKARFDGFRDRYEDGDLSVSLRRQEDDDVRFSPRKRRRGMPEIQKVRREYRRTIRKHRKTTPESWETPAVIEEKAGIDKTPQGQDLHVRYEKARYGETQS